MLTLFNHPASPNARQYDPSTLNEFIDWVNKSPLPESTRLDCIKILETMRWIKVNPEQLREFIDNKENYLSQLPQRDQANGVVRDHLGTSLHFNSYQWCQLINLSSDPTTIPSEDLKKLVQNKSAYALFDNTVYFVNPDASLTPLAFETKNIATLKKIFPAAKDVPQEGSKKNSEIMTSLTGHAVQTPGERAIHDLSEIVTTFENTFQTLQEANNSLGLLSFIAKCDYDKDRGCLEARIEKAMLFAGTIEASNGRSSLEDLLQVCRLLHFLDLENDIYNFVMASEFFSPFYGQQVFYLQQEQTLTQDLIFTAMEELLSYRRPNPDELTAETTRKATDFQQWQATWQAEARANEARTFQNLIKNAEVVIGFEGMVQYRFKNQAKADQLNQWLRGCKSLAAYGIERCKTKQELKGTETEYVVRLMPLQHDMLTRETSASTSVAVPEAVQAQAAPKAPSLIKEVTKASPDIINQIDTTLLAACRQDSAAFQALVAKASVSSIDTTLHIQDIFRDNALILAAKFQDSAAFQALVAKASVSSIDKTLPLQSNNGNTALHVAAGKQDSAAFQALVAKASVSSIDTTLHIQDIFRQNALMVAAKFQDSASFQALVNKVSIKSIDNAFLIQNMSGQTALHFAAAKQDSAGFQAFVNKASREGVDNAFLIQNMSGQTALHLAAAKQDSAGFQAFVNKASRKSIDNALLLQDKFGQTVLHIAALQQDNAGLALIHASSSKSINQTLPKRDEDGYSALHNAHQKQNKVAFRLLIDKASPEVIRQSLSIHNNMRDTIDWIEAQLDFINTIAEFESWIVLLLKISGRLSSWPVDKAFTDKETVLQEIVDIEDRRDLQIAAKIMQRWAVLDQITALIVPNLTLTSSEGKVSPLHVNLIRLGNGDSALLTDANLANTIQTHGLASRKEFYIVQKYCANNPPEACSLRNVLNFVNHYNVLQPSLLKPSILTLNKELQEGNVLIKTFSGWQPQAWPDFIKQLKNPAQRKQLRKPLGTTDTSHKFHHLTGEVTVYSKKERVKPHHTTHAKKQSATLISPEKCTPLFQSHQPDTLLVGVALRADPNLDLSRYDSAKAKLKALLYTDAGTYGRRWRGSLAEVTQYAQKTKNYTSLEAFKKAIRHNTTQYNEVLTEPSKNSLMGIVIGRDTPKARKLARQYQKDIKSNLGLDLPIILYEANRKKLIEDLDLYEALKKIKDLIIEKELLLNTPPVTSPSFFRRYNSYEGKTYPTDIVNRLNAIDKTLSELKALVEDRPRELDITLE